MRSQAYAPIHHAGMLVGVLAIGSAEGSTTVGLAECIPALVEFADLAGALIGPDLAARAGSLHARQRIAEVIENVAFHPVFQPIVDLRNDRIIGYEALTRFEDGAAPDEQFVGSGAVLEPG